MTKEERLDWLCRLRADLNNGIIFTPWNKEFTEALTGILEQESYEDKIIDEHYKKGFTNGIRTAEWRYDKIRAEISALIPPLGNWMYEEGHIVEQTACEVIADVLQIIDKYKVENEEV